MNRLLKLAALFSLAGLIHISCQKELSCEDCPGKNLPPVANAGPDQIIVLPKNSTLLDGSASTNRGNILRHYSTNLGRKGTTGRTGN